MGALGGVGEGRSYASGEEIGVPKGVSGFFGARGKREIQVGAGRREPEPGEHPGLGGFPHTAGALDASLHLQETQWFPKAVPLAWKKGKLMELGTNSDSVGCFKGIPATRTILGNPLGQLHQNPGSGTRCRAWFGAPGDGSATSELWWLPVDPLFPPHPLQFQPQIPAAHRFRLRWVTSVTAQLCWGFREATEALALWSRAPVGPGHLLSHRILEICPAPLEAAGKTPWSNFSCCARSPAPWKELCSSSAASTPEEHPLTSPAVAETAAQKGGDPQIPQKGAGEQHPRGNPPQLWEWREKSWRGNDPEIPLVLKEVRSCQGLSPLWAAGVVGEQRPHPKSW